MIEVLVVWVKQRIFFIFVIIFFQNIWLLFMLVLQYGSFTLGFRYKDAYGMNDDWP